MIVNILPIISSLLMFSCMWWKQFELIIAGRFIVGIHGGEYALLLFTVGC